MAAIVKASASLAAGNLVILKRNFAASDSGQMTYTVDYCCLSQFASNHVRKFKTGATPPTDLPAAMLQLQLTKTPTLVDLETETMNGLSYFRAVYSSGVETDVTITEESDIKTYSYTKETPGRIIALGFTWSVPYTIDGSTEFIKTGEEVIPGKVETFTVEYISVTQRATSKNANLPTVRGYTLGIDTTVEAMIKLVQEGTGNNKFGSKVVNSFSKTKNSKGEYTYSIASTGVMG